MIFTAMLTKTARHLQAGGADANGKVPQRCGPAGSGLPCRHCLQMVAEGAEYLVLAYRPFESLQPYAETGPVFFCADRCSRGETRDVLPAILQAESYIVRAYSADERIRYGTGMAQEA